MSPNKNNGWILCPSNRFPGKFYYYNVLNGESVWSFVDSEKRHSKLDVKTHDSNKCHSYPEPSTPPDQGPTNVFPIQSKFGQVIFPKYIHESDFKESPIEKPKLQISCIQKANKTTQTCLPDDIIEKKTIYNFGNYQHQTKNFDIISIIDNPFKNVRIYNPKKNILRKSILNIDPKHVNIKRQFIDDSSLSSCNQIRNGTINWKNYSKPSIPKPFQKINHTRNDIPMSFDDTDKTHLEYATETNNNGLTNVPHNQDIKKISIGNCTIVNDNKVEKETHLDYVDSVMKIRNNKITYGNNNSYVDNFENNNEWHLDKNDLRHKLHAKKRKLDRVLPCKEKKVKFDVIKNRDEEYKNKDVQRENEYDKKNTDKSKSNEKYKNINNNNKNRENPENDWMYLSRNNNNNNIHENIFLQKAYDIKPFIISQKDVAYTDIKSMKIHNKEFYDTDNIKNTSTNINQFAIDEELYDINRRTEKLHLIDENVRFDPKLQNTRCLKNKKKTISHNKYIPYTSSSSNLNQNSICSENNNLNRWYKFGNQYEHITKDDLNFETYISIKDDKSKLNRFEIIKGSVFKNHSLGDMLKRLCIIDIDQCVSLKMCDLICCYTQIMEDFIYRIIKTSLSPPPYTLSEVLLKLLSVSRERPKVSDMIVKILDLDILCPKSGYIKSNTRPKIMIKAVCYGVLLVEAFKEHGVDVEDTEESFKCLLLDIEEPIDVELSQAPASRAGSNGPRQYFVKKKSDVVRYLQKHYPELESDNGNCADQEIVTQDKIRERIVLRTTGKNIRSIKINNKNELTFEKTSEMLSRERSYIKDNVKIKLQINDDNSETLDATEPNNVNETLNRLNRLNGIEENEKANSKVKGNGSNAKFDENILLVDDQGSNVNDAESEQAYQLVKMFLMELSSTLQLIYAFIEECFYQLAKDPEPDKEIKSTIYEDAKDTYAHLKDIIITLRCIIERENQDETVKHLVVRAEGAAADKRVTLYLKIILKCLEQARIMEASLRIVLNMSDHNCSISTGSDVYETTYINIFE